MKLSKFLLENKTDISNKTVDVEIRRLSDIAGEPVYVTVKALELDVFHELIEDGQNYTKEVIANCLVSPTPKELAEAYGVATVREALDKLLTAGEIKSLTIEIEKLGGFHQLDLVSVVKKK